MGRLALAAALTWMVAGCGSFDGTVLGDRNREVLGVANAQPGTDPAAISPAVAQTLDWKTRQLCTLGAVELHAGVEAAEDQKQLADRELRCKDYELNAFGVSFANHLTSRLWPF